MPVQLPCGQCIGCRLERSRQWAVRCVHEASLYYHNAFVTLTYSNKFLPKDSSLDYEAPVLFMKRLRKEFGAGVRSFGCGEYGERFGRPHYHLLLFNCHFVDKVPFKVINGVQLFRSPVLESLWTFGHSSIGDVTFESAAYVARYCTKKITGSRSFFHYHDVDMRSGEILAERLPERALCVSRRPGIGRAWYDKFGDDVRRTDSIVVRGVVQRPVSYYDRIFDIDYPEDRVKVCRKRKALALRFRSREELLFPYKICGDRERVKEKCLALKFKLLKRSFEDGSS